MFKFIKENLGIIGTITKILRIIKIIININKYFIIVVLTAFDLFLIYQCILLLFYGINYTFLMMINFVKIMINNNIYEF
jgi:hypothetical protein